MTDLQKSFGDFKLRLGVDISKNRGFKLDLNLYFGEL